MGCLCSVPVDTQLADQGKVPSPLRIKWSEIDIDGYIEFCRWGQVFTGTWQGNKVAVKLLWSPEVMRRNLIPDWIKVAECHHPALVSVHGIVDEKKSEGYYTSMAHVNAMPMFDDYLLALVMPYYSQGNLLDFMTKPETKLQYQEQDVFARVSMALQVAEGMAYLHEHDIIHGDLKTSNVLIDSLDRQHVGLTGHGLTPSSIDHYLNVKQSLSTYACLSRHSVHIYAPEVLRNSLAPRGKAADVYAYAMILLEMMTGTPVDPSRRMEPIVAGKRPPIPVDIPESVQEVIRRCWAQDPNARPSAAQVVQMLEQASRDLITETGHPDTASKHLASPQNI